MKKRNVIVLIFLLIIIVGILTYYLLNNKSIETKNETDTAIRDKDSNISLDIYIDYEKKETGLVIKDLKYSLTYKDVPVRVYEIYGFSFNKENLSGGKVSIWYSEIIYSTTSSYFPLNSSPIILATPGNYTFYYYVYDCRNVEQLTNKTCSDADKKDVAEKIDPINSMKKVIEFNPISS